MKELITRFKMGEEIEFTTRIKAKKRLLWTNIKKKTPREIVKIVKNL